VLRLFVRSIEKDCGQKLRNHYNQVNWGLASCNSGGKSDKPCLMLVPCLLDGMCRLPPNIFQGNWDYCPLTSWLICVAASLVSQVEHLNSIPSLLCQVLLLCTLPSFINANAKSPWHLAVSHSTS
jgi:hypothetical protein